MLVVETPYFLVLLGGPALGWFCLGLAAFKSGMIDNADHPLWRSARNYCLVPGLLISLIAAGIWQMGYIYLGTTIIYLIAPFVTLGYIGLIATISRPRGPILSPVMATGGASLTIYLGQSILLAVIFSSYGGGFWGKLDQVTALVVAISVTTFLIIAVVVWQRYCKLGPFEWVLRRITYAQSGKLNKA